MSELKIQRLKTNLILERIKNMKRILYGLLLLILWQMIAQICFAQDRTMYVARGGSAHTMRYFSQPNIPATVWLNPYLDENWAGGYIIFSDSIQWLGDLRLDLFRKRMEMRIEGDTFMISEPFVLNQIRMGDAYYVYSPFVIEKRNKRIFGADYFEVLNPPGKVNLLLRRNVRVNESSIAPSNMLFGGKVEEKKSFAQVKQYYLQTEEDGAAILLRRKRSSLLKHLADKKDAIDAFAKANKLSFSDPSDVAKIVEHYNAISIHN
jgi:hypothetical protein